MRLFVETPRPNLPAPDRALGPGCVLRVALIAAAVAALMLPTGCVRRRLNVRSNPPGALVFVDNQQIGTTPCSTDFTYYGTREIRLVKPGFETLTVNQPIPMPWYQIPPIDFVSENLVPNRITDHRTVSFDLQPQVIVPTEQLLDRANQLRQETQQTATTPPAMVVLPGGVAAPGAVPPPAFAPESTMPPGSVSPPGGFAPAPANTPQPAYPPIATPTPLPPVTNSQPPGTYAPATPAPLGGTANPYASPAPYNAAPYGAAPGTPPAYSPYGSVPVESTPAPFAAPTLPNTAAPLGTTAPPGATAAPLGNTAPIGTPLPQTLPPTGAPQQGPPIVSPPLR